MNYYGEKLILYSTRPNSCMRCYFNIRKNMTKQYFMNENVPIMNVKANFTACGSKQLISFRKKNGITYIGVIPFLYN